MRPRLPGWSTQLPENPAASLRFDLDRYLKWRFHESRLDRLSTAVRGSIERQRQKLRRSCFPSHSLILQLTAEGHRR